MKASNGTGQCVVRLQVKKKIWYFFLITKHIITFGWMLIINLSIFCGRFLHHPWFPWFVCKHNCPLLLQEHSRVKLSIEYLLQQSHLLIQTFLLSLWACWRQYSTCRSPVIFVTTGSGTTDPILHCYNLPCFLFINHSLVLFSLKTGQEHITTDSPHFRTCISPELENRQGNTADL